MGYQNERQVQIRGCRRVHYRRRLHNGTGLYQTPQCSTSFFVDMAVRVTSCGKHGQFAFTKISKIWLWTLAAWTMPSRSTRSQVEKAASRLTAAVSTSDMGGGHTFCKQTYDNRGNPGVGYVFGLWLRAPCSPARLNPMLRLLPDICSLVLSHARVCKLMLTFSSVSDSNMAL